MATDQLAETTVVPPSLGESVKEATVTRWLKKAGDYVEAEEPLLEVATDKVDTEIPAPIPLDGVAAERGSNGGDVGDNASATDHEIHTEEQELSLNTELTRQIHNSQRNCMSMFSANRQPAIRRSDDQTEARSGRAQTCFDVTR